LRDAVEALEKSTELKGQGDCSDWFFLAMAHWGLGNRDRAREWFQKAVQFMEKNNLSELSDPELQRFRSEASAVLGIEAQSRAESK
jgi:hypothetical protein